MNIKKSRRTRYARLFGNHVLSERQRGNTSIPSRFLLIEQLEPRILMAGTPTQVLFVAQPTQTVAGAAMAPVTVKIADANGFQTTDTSKVFLTVYQGPPGELNFVMGVFANAVNGIATFDHLIFSGAGSYTMVASDGALRSVTSNPFDITGVASGLTFATQPSSTPVNGKMAPVTVKIVDSTGNTITTANSAVTLAITSGTPSGVPLAGTTTVLAVNGVATFSDLSVGTAGSYVLSAVDGLLSGVSDIFNITGPADHLAFIQQPLHPTVGLAIAPAVQVAVEDALGHIIANDSSNVTITVNSGPGSLIGTTSMQAINGVATFTNMGLDFPGTYQLIASDDQMSSSTSNALSSTFIVNGLPAKLAFTQQPADGSLGGAPIASTVKVTVEDTNGNPVLDDASTVFLSLAGTGSLSGTLFAVAVNGVATFDNLVLGAGGDYQLFAFDGGLAPATSNSFNVSPGSVALTFEQDPNNVAATSIVFPAIVVDVLDFAGSNFTSGSSQVTLQMVGGPSGGSMSGTTSVATIQGQAIFNDITFSKPGTYTLVAYDGNLVTETSIDITVTNAAAKLAFATQPIKTAMAGTVLPAFTVRVTDAGGKTVATDHSPVTLSIIGPDGATIGGTTSVTTINGTATFSDIVLTIAGKYTFKVTDGSLVSATSSALTITPLLTKILDPQNPNLLLNPQILVSSATTSTLVGKTIPAISVIQADQYGNVITTVNSGTASLSILAGPSLQLNGTLTAKYVKGVATFKNLSINTAGSYAIQLVQATTIPATVPYAVGGTSNIATTISPVINSMRAPSHSANYAFGANISLSTSIGSLVASKGITYLNGTNSETARLVTIGGVTLETGTINATTGAVNFNFNDLPPGDYDVQVVYDGDTNHTGARFPRFHFTVGPTSTTLTVSATALNLGDTLTLTASAKSVLNNQPIITGSIQFFVDSDPTPIATVAIGTTSTHTAVYAFATAATGQHTYTAAFVANSSLNSSISATKLVTIT